MTVIVLDEQKLNPYDTQAGHKTLNYFSRLGALRAANPRGAGEALWFNVHNYLQSGSISNVFIVKSGRLITPPTPREMQDARNSRRNAVSQKQRSARRDTCARSSSSCDEESEIELHLAAIDIDRLLDADEVFITNSIMGVMPVCRIEEKVIGDEKPGPITTRLATRYQSGVGQAQDS